MSTGEHILSFFQSLIPGYTEALNQRQQQGQEEGAVGGPGAEAAANRFDVRHLMATLREFLAHQADQENAAAGLNQDGQQNNNSDHDDINEID